MLTAMDDLMAIGEFAERTGLSPSRLRTYAAVGLLAPAAVDASSGYRYYALGQVREAHVIDALRRAEVPLVDIATFLQSPSAEQLDDWARRVEHDHEERKTAHRRARRLLHLLPDITARERAGPARKEGPMKLQTATRTDIGRIREGNEDRSLASDRIVAVADGMGGAPGGETAAALTVAVVESVFTGASGDELSSAVRAANRAVFERASDDGLEGMGTTLCAVGLTEAGELYVANVGDSRAYLLRDGALQRLTEDHSITADLVRQGEIGEHEARDHPMHAVLTRAIGVANAVDVDLTHQRALPADRLLLCSDGLVNELTDDAVHATLRTVEDLDEAADALVRDAVAKGGRDNVTVVVADVLAG